MVFVRQVEQLQLIAFDDDACHEGQAAEPTQQYDVFIVSHYPHTSLPNALSWYGTEPHKRTFHHHTDNAIRVGDTNTNTTTADKIDN